MSWKLLRLMKIEKKWGSGCIRLSWTTLKNSRLSTAASLAFLQEQKPESTKKGCQGYNLTRRGYQYRKKTSNSWDQNDVEDLQYRLFVVFGNEVVILSCTFCKLQCCTENPVTMDGVRRTVEIRDDFFNICTVWSQSNYFCVPGSGFWLSFSLVVG